MVCILMDGVFVSFEDCNRISAVRQITNIVNNGRICRVRGKTSSRAALGNYILTLFRIIHVKIFITHFNGITLRVTPLT